MAYFVGNANVLAAGTCNLVAIKNALGAEFSAFQNRIINAGLNTAERAKLYQDFVASSVATRNILKTEDGMKAWKALIERTQMRIDIIQLAAATKCVANSKLKSLGITQQALSDIMIALKNDYATYGNTVKALDDEILTTLANFGDFLTANPTSLFVNFEKIISDLKGGGFPNRKGSHWILKNISQDATTFGGKKLSFNTTQTVNGTNYYVDAELDDALVKFLEYKSGPNTIQSKDEFLREFVKRDLSNTRVSNLSQIEWRKDVPDPTLKGRINGWLSSIEGRTELKKIDVARASQLLNNPNLLLATPDEIADSFINHLSIDASFTAIFK